MCDFYGRLVAGFGMVARGAVLEAGVNLMLQWVPGHSVAMSRTRRGTIKQTQTANQYDALLAKLPTYKHSDLKKSDLLVRNPPKLVRA